MESATTNLSELTCDFVRLWQNEKLQHTDVRELFVHQVSVVAPVAVEVEVGTEIDTELVYPAPTDEQVPSLKGLLEYLDARGTGGTVTKNYTNNRKHFSLQEGAVQTVQQKRVVNKHRHEQLHTTESHTTVKKSNNQHTHRHQVNVNELNTTVKKNTKTQRIFLEVFAPVMLVRRVTNVRVTRPIFIFAS
jgi:hypothetical protein